MCAEIIVLHVLQLTKTFNIAGIQTAAVIVADENIRHRVITGLETDHLAETNVLQLMRRLRHIVKVGEWLDDLREYLWENRQFAEKFIKRKNSADKARGVRRYISYVA